MVDVALERVPVPLSITGGTWRLKAPVAGVTLPTYATPAGDGASLDPVAAGATRYAPPGTYLLEHTEAGVVTDRILYVNAPAALERRLAMTDDAVVGFYGAEPVARQAALTASNAAAISDAIYGAAEAAVIRNTRTRLVELEARLRAYGLLP